MARRTKSSLRKRYRTFIRSPQFRRSYAVFGAVALVFTTALWALAGARLQASNANQLVYPQLFEHSHTFHQALFPADHTLFIKWPLFWLVKLFGLSAGAYVFFTILAVLVTVAGLAFVIYRIDKRPLVFGTICLALASVLALLSSLSSSKSLLPLNMALLTTGNLEYLLYLLSLWLLITAKGLRSRRFWLATVCLGLLVANDRLFLGLSLGGASLALVVYALLRKWNLVSLVVDWLVGGLIAGVLGIGLVNLIKTVGITNFSSRSDIGNFGVVHGLHGLSYGTIFGIAGPAYIVNALVLLVGLSYVWGVVFKSWSRPANANRDIGTKLAILLCWSALAAGGLFVTTSHSAANARYLSIVVFSIFVSIAAAGRRRTYSAGLLLVTGVVVTVGLVFGLLAISQSYSNQSQALQPVSSRNKLVGQILQQHPSKVLVGDYWRVMPIKALGMSGSQSVSPLTSCTRPTAILSSKAWQPNLSNHSFVYLLSFDRSLTNYPACSLKQVVNAYGRPNASALVAGDLKRPKELLLFYDSGSHPVKTPVHTTAQPQTQPQEPSTVLPITPGLLPNTACPGLTVMNFVAHQDDDLLFMNPDILHDIQAGYCVRTVYLTAGDDGGDRFYWLRREQGSEAAYSTMSGDSSVWTERIVELSDHEFVNIANPRGNSKISLIFMRLPDGNLAGQGFPASLNQSLAKLDAGKISQIESVDGQSSYTAAQLQATLVRLMRIYQPAEMRTQANFISASYPDHSDHMAVGRFVKKAYASYEQSEYDGLLNIPLLFYIGYPARQLPANVSDSDLQAKEAAFLAYTKYDTSVCHSAQECSHDAGYQGFLSHQVRNPY